MYRVEIYELFRESATLSTVVYAFELAQLFNYKKYCIVEGTEEHYRVTQVQEVDASPELEAAVEKWRGLLAASERHHGDLGTLRTLGEFNNEGRIWYKNSVEENTSSADSISPPSIEKESTMTAKSTPASIEAAAETAAQAANASQASAAQAATAANAAQAAAAQAVHPVVYAHELKPTVMERVKDVASSPTAKTAGGILMSVLAGFLGGVAYQEAQKRGYFNKDQNKA